MKTLVAVAILAMSVTSFANTVCSSSWDAIYKKGLSADFPKIKMDNVSNDQIGTVWVSVDGLCVAGDVLKTKKAEAVCMGVERGEAGRCNKFEQHVLSTAVNYDHPIQQGESDDFIMVPDTHALDYLISVGYQGEAFTEICKKEYSIDTCDLK